MEEYSIIKDYPNYAVSNTGKMINIKKKGKELKQFTGKYSPHLIVRLYKNSRYSQKLVHRLMGEAFLDNPNNLPVIDHRNQNSTDNSIENLRCCSYSQNSRNIKRRGNITKVPLKGGQRWSWSVRLSKNGKIHSKSLLTEEEAKEYLQKWIEENDSDIL